MLEKSGGMEPSRVYDYGSVPESNPTETSGDTVNIRYTRFTIAGLPGEKHAVFLPDRVKLTISDLEEICAALGMEMPSMTLCGLGSLRHPSTMTTPQLRSSPAFEKIMREARANLGFDEQSGSESGVPFGWCPPIFGLGRDNGSRNLEQWPAEMVGGETLLPGRQDERKNKALEDFANCVMEKKIATAVNGIANAAFQTNAWTFTGPKISSFEVFLQRCVENGTTEVLRTVAAHMQDRAYMESKISRNLMKQLFDSSEEMSPEAVEVFEPLTLPGDLWHPDKNLSASAEFREHGWDYWSFDSMDSEAAKNHPLLQWPWPWADLFFLFYRERSDSGPPGGAGVDVDWGFMTEKRHDRDAIPFQPDLLAPPGYVLMSGGSAMKKKLLQVMQMLRPVVVIDNTPGVAKQMSALLAVTKSVLQCNPQACRHFLRDGAKLSATPTALELLRDLSPGKVLKHIEREFGSSSLERHAELTLSDIVGIVDLIKLRPQAFKETISVVDPLSDTLEQILSRLSSTFTSAYSGSMELNASPVNGQLVLKGWRLHRKLVQSTVKLRQFAAGMEMAVVIVMLLSSVLAVIVVYLHLERDRIEAAMLLGSAPQDSIQEAMARAFPVEIVGILKVWMLLLPVTAGILMTLQTHFHFFQKWAHVHFASGQVVSEIYQFLGNVGRYSRAASTNRQRFLKRLQDITRSLAMLGIREDEFMGGEENGKVDFAADSEALQQHINLSVYGIAPPTWLMLKARELRCCCGWDSDRAVEDGRFVIQEHIQDLTAPLSADAYMEIRVAPLMRYYKGLSNSAARLRTEMNVAIFLCLGVGSGLAAFSFALWIPVIIVASLCLIILVHNFTPLESLTAVNNALTALHNLDLRWHGSRVSEQRSEAMKKRIILKTEKITLAVAAAISRAPMMPDDDEDGEEDDFSKDGTPSTSTPLSRQESARTTPAGPSHQAPTPQSPFDVRSGSNSPPGRGSWTASPGYRKLSNAWM
jgi:hypothetical protein